MALGSEPSDEIASILEEIDGGDAAAIREWMQYRATHNLDTCFDRVVDRVLALPDDQRVIAVATWEGFLSRAPLDL